MMMASLFARSCWKVVEPPRPNEVPRPGTVEECHMRAWFSIDTGARRREQLLDEVVLLVVQRGAAEVGEAERPLELHAVGVLLLPGARARGDDPVGDHVHRRVEVEVLPVLAVRAGGSGRSSRASGC
jgi:hypothetical protein